MGKVVSMVNRLDLKKLTEVVVDAVKAAQADADDHYAKFTEAVEVRDRALDVILEIDPEHEVLDDYEMTEIEGDDDDAG